MILVTNTLKSFSSHNWISEYFDMMETRFFHAHDLFLEEFGGNGNWLFWGFLFFLAVILVIYIKSIKEMFKSEKSEGEYPDEEYYDEYSDEYYTEDYVGNEGEEDMLNNKETVVSRQRKMEKMYLKRRNSAQIRELAELEKDEELSQAIIANSVPQKNDENAAEITDVIEENTAINIRPKQYTLPDLVDLIICLLGRKVSDNKIAQSVYSLLGDVNIRGEVFQFIHAVKDFIGYCNAGKFDELHSKQNYPSNAMALYNWGNGDNKNCLELLEGLLALQISAAQDMPGISKDLTYSLAAGYACTLGTIGCSDNYELATNSFELAAEMAPQSVVAINLCADMYRKDGNNAKAKEMYVKVLELADSITYPEQKANASWWLSKYYKEQGNINKSVELENEANGFYSKCGLNEELTPQEKEVLEIIESTKNTTLEKYIKQLLNMER